MGQLEPIAIKNLLIWTDNPRMASENILQESEAIRILIDEVGLDKMIELAKDIFKHGLNSHRQPIVVSNNDGTYNVYDGNRRISTIKCILAGEMHFKHIENEIGLTLETELLVYVTDVNEALRLIDLEHAGELDGRGLISWDPFQRDYAYVQNNQKPFYPYAFVVIAFSKTVYI